MEAAPPALRLDDPLATDPGRVGAKAANLAVARRAGLPALPGAVLTTAWDRADLRTAVAVWREVSGDGAHAVVVRSSSTGEDGAASSMAGVFTSVLDVHGVVAFLDAVEEVLASAQAARDAGLVDAPIAVLVQPMLTTPLGGVAFGADPVTGRRDRVLVAAAAGGPAPLVSGEVEGWTGLLDRSGRLREVRSTGGEGRHRPSPALLRRLADLLARAGRTWGAPQDVEWAVDEQGELVLLQARPITSLPLDDSPVFGPGPLAETFPDPLAPLEEDLWVEPLRAGLREALVLSGARTRRAVHASPVVVTVDGRPAADLQVLGVDEPPVRGLRRLDPRPPARRLRAAWRVGWLRAAFSTLALDVVRRVDADLLAVPELHRLSDEQLVALLRNVQRTLVGVHGHEALAGLLLPGAASHASGAAMALAAVAAAPPGASRQDLVRRDPVVLALVPPRIGPLPAIPDVAGALGPRTDVATAGEQAAVAREALRLRARWLQELSARAAWELAGRLAERGRLPYREAVRRLRLEELAGVVLGGPVPADLDARLEPPARALPARFRLAADGHPVAAPPAAGRRRGAAATGAVGAGGGVATGVVHHGDDLDAVPVGSVLVVPHLDPRLATVLPRLAGLVAETGNPLSHLAILAREHGVATVVGFAGATTRFADGDLVVVDGQAGTVEPVVVPADGAALVTGVAS